MKRIRICNFLFFGIVASFLTMSLISCEDAGTLAKFNGGSVKYKPPVIDGDTISLYQYYPYEGSSIWIAKSKNYSTTSLTYRVGKHDETVIIINGDPFRRVKGSVVMENDSLVLIKKSN